MIPKTPSSYRIPEPIRSEILALIKDLDLVFVRKSFCPLPEFKYIPFVSSSPSVFLDKSSLKSVVSCRDFMERNHHRKVFTNVYPSDYYFEELSLGW